VEGGVAIHGEYSITAPRGTVWSALIDPSVLAACIPGCVAVGRISDTEFEIELKAKLGPFRSSFLTRILLTDLDPARAYRLNATGKGLVGFGSGEARVSLQDGEAGTVLAYSATLSIGGKLASVGSRLAESATGSYVDAFFQNFARRVSAP
jgi:carbon monoxide dehydrogenase subunit G